MIDKAGRSGSCKPETEAKYRAALALYSNTDLSNQEICRECGVSVRGFSRYISTYHRDLMLKRYGIKSGPVKAGDINLGQRRGQKPATHAKYKEAIEACDSMEYIECNVSEIAREFGLSGSNLARQLRTHYPEILEFRERARQKFGVNDNLPRGARLSSEMKYSEAIELLRSDPYITVHEAADKCDVSYLGLEQHLLFYHKELVDKRIRKRGKALGRKRKGEITGRGTVHAPTAETVLKYAEALNLYRNSTLSVGKIARQTGVSLKGLYNYLKTWHGELVSQRKNISPAADKYSAAISKLKEGGASIATVAATFGLNPDNLRQYINQHEPELRESLGRIKTADGKHVSKASLEKYKEAIHDYETTADSLKSIALRFGFNVASFGQFIRRHYPELIERRKQKLKETLSR